MVLASERTLLGLCRQAQREGVLHLKALREIADPGDIALLEYIEDRVREALGDLEDWARPGFRVPGDRARVAEAGEIRELLKMSFPSRARSMGEGPMGRDVAMYLIECDQEEAAAFFRNLAARAHHEGWSLYFSRLAERQEQRLKKSREVLLRAGLEFVAR